MSVRNPGYMSRANGAYFIVDHVLRCLRLIKKKKNRLESLPVGGVRSPTIPEK